MRILPTRPKLAWTRIRYEDTGSASPNRGENIFVDRRASNQSHDAEAFAETGPRRRISILPFLICHGSGCATLIASNRFPGLALELPSCARFSALSRIIRSRNQASRNAGPLGRGRLRLRLACK